MRKSRKALLVCVLVAVFAPSCSTLLPTMTGGNDIAAGLREALRVGVDRVVTQVGQPGGFSSDPAIHIPLPGALGTVESALTTIGMGSMVQDLDARLNRAAEEAAPEAKTVFWQAISQMTLTDAEKIYNGPNDAATQYFRRTMTAPLTQRMTPIVESSLEQAGAVKAFDGVMARYSLLPIASTVKTDLTGYAVEKTLDGIFHYLAQEEAAIRTNPAARTTELLRRVFG